MALAHDAGLGKLSVTSVIAGMLCAFGCFALLAAVAATAVRALGIETTDDISGDWREVGIGSGVILAVVLFASYFFGGYVAGRMARRAGAMNGLLVFVLGVLVAGGVGAAVSTQTDTDTVMSNLRSVGVPTSGDEWMAIGTGVGAAAVVCMLLGSLLGGLRGERWHGRLVSRALDPSVGDPIDLREGDREPTLDEERAVRRDRVMTATGGRPSGEHFAGRTSHDEDHMAHDDMWDGSNRTRRITDTKKTLDADLDRHN